MLFATHFFPSFNNNSTSHATMLSMSVDLGSQYRSTFIIVHGIFLIWYGRSRSYPRRRRCNCSRLFGNILYVVCKLYRRQDVFCGWVLFGGLNIGGEPETQRMWGIFMTYGNFLPHKRARSGERLDKIPDNFSKNPMIDSPNENKKPGLPQNISDGGTKKSQTNSALSQPPEA